MRILWDGLAGSFHNFSSLFFKWQCLKRCLSEDRLEVDDVGATNLPFGLEHRQTRHLNQPLQLGHHQSEQACLVELLKRAGEDHRAQHIVVEGPACVRAGDRRGDSQPMGGIQGQQEATGGADQG